MYGHYWSAERTEEKWYLLQNRIFQYEDEISWQQINAEWNHDVLGFHLTLVIEIGRLYQKMSSFENVSFSPIPLSLPFFRRSLTAAKMLFQTSLTALATIQIFVSDDSLLLKRENWEAKLWLVWNLILWKKKRGLVGLAKDWPCIT